jgi:tRNA modification GTPase
MAGRADPVRGAALAISAQTGVGIEDLWTLLEARAGQLGAASDEMAINARQRALLTRAELMLRTGAAEHDTVLQAEAVRSARGAFDAITGRASVEAVLDAVFGNFCIGK